MKKTMCSALFSAVFLQGGGGKTYLTSKALSLTTLTKNIALAFLLLFFTVPSFAQGEFTVDNIIYELRADGNSVRVKGNNLTINTSLTIPPTVESNGTRYNVVEIRYLAFYNCANLTSISLPNSIDSIGVRAFNGCTNLTSVTISDVTSIIIGGNAFQGCTNLTSINLPDGVTSIGGNAFNGCTNLASITIPGSVTTISGKTFQGCISLNSVTIQEGVTTIKANAFDGCTALSTITLPSSITTIQEYAFSNSGLTSIIIPNGVEAISDYTFSNCAELSSIELPNTLTTIGKYAFSNCAALSSIELPNTLDTIGKYAFNNCAALSSIELPTTRIGQYAFSNSGLTSITFPSGVTTINEYAFSNCTALSTITLPNTITTIGKYAFQGCTNLTSITLPKDFSSGKRWPYLGCPNLEAIYVADGNSSLSSEDGVLYNHDKTKLCVYPAGKTGESFTIPNSVTTIEDSAFLDCVGLTSITLPVNFSSGDRRPYIGCTNLQAIYVADGNNSLTSEDGVLYNLEKTKLCIYPAGKTGESFTIPSSVTSIGNRAFQECKNLTSIDIPSGVTSINNGAFWDCTGLTSIILPNTVTYMGINVFRNCISLTSITLPTAIPSIGQQTFLSCRKLKSVTIPGSVASIGEKAFNGCSKLTSVTMERETPPTLSNINTFPYSNTGFKIYVPCGTQSAYTSAALWSSLPTGTITTATTLDEEITSDRYLADCDCDFPSTITIKDGASLSASDYSSLSTKLNGKTVNVEKELAIDEFSLIGNIGGASTYDFIGENVGNNTTDAHSMVALPFYYKGNSWGVGPDGNGAINGTDEPVSDGQSFFVYPTTDQYGENSTINGDTYTTLTQSISSSNLKLSDFTVSLINSSNSTNWFALSNPFIGRLNLSKFYTTNSDALQSAYAYFWDNTEHDWVALENINTTDEYALYPATGFMVEGQSANSTFNFNVADIVTTEPITTTKSAQANRIEFTATSNDIAKKMYAHIDEVSSNGFGRMDASVLCSSKEDAVNPYMQVEGHNLLDNYFSSLPATFDVNFNAYKSNAIDFALTQGMEDVEVTLIDIANANAETVLNVNEPVSIDVTAGQNEGRYQLRFSKKNVGINAVASEDNSIQIWNNNREVTINGKDLKRVEIFNTLGQMVYSSNLAGNSTTFDSKLNAGAYIIKATDSKSIKSEKIIIR